MSDRHAIAADTVWLEPGTSGAYTVRWEGGVIVAVEPGRAADAEFLEGSIVTPGFVNAHCHLDLTFDLEPTEADTLPELGETPFTEWLLSVRDRREAAGEAGLRDAAHDGVQRSLASGTTTIVDYDPTGASIPALAASPLRRVILREIISFSPDLTERRDAWRAFLDTPPPPARGGAELELRGLAPHAPYTVHRAVLDAALEEVRQRGRPWSMHVAEQAWEAELLVDGTGPYADWLRNLGIDLDRFGLPGVPAIEYLTAAGALFEPASSGDPGARGELASRESVDATGPLLVHANYLTEAAVENLAHASDPEHPSHLRPTVVFCPRSHRFFGHENHPLVQLRERGVRCCLGTDGLVSNHSLSILDELRTCHGMFPSLTPDELLAMVTVEPHAALAQRLGTGRIEPGAPADLVRWTAPTPQRTNLETIVDPNVAAHTTWVAGERAPGA
ncbi:MAG: amidohydrolase family protein [Planctomycetota bacterium]